MDEKREAFLKQIGFSISEQNEDIEMSDYDFILPDGRYSRGPDCLYAITLEETFDTDKIEEFGESIDIYWAKGWNTDYCDMRRSNFDSYKGRYYKVFPTRYLISNFVFTKSLRRILRKNNDLETIIRPLRITPKKEELFLNYYLNRHKEPPRSTLAKSYEYIKYFPTDLTELCVFKENKLVACSIFEVGSYSILSNMAFWDLSQKNRSLGTFTILKEIEYAIQKGLFYYYLGNYYKQNPNYQYKTRFKGLELYDWDNDYWINFNSEMAKMLLDQKLPRRRD